MCGKAPVTVVLHPVAVHFKGSGFYTTDYGRGGKRKDAAAKDGGGETKTDSSSSDKTEPKKAAEA